MLVVTTRSEANLWNLLDAAKDYAKLYYFTTLDAVRQYNLLLDPIWKLPNGTVRAKYESSRLSPGGGNTDTSRPYSRRTCCVAIRIVAVEATYLG